MFGITLQTLLEVICLIFPYFLFLVQQIQSTYTILLGFEANKDMNWHTLLEANGCVFHFSLFSVLGLTNTTNLYSILLGFVPTKQIVIEVCVEFTP